MNSESVFIREVRLDELEILQQLATSTFVDTYASENTEENMNTYVSENFNKNKLIAQLKNPDVKFFFALIDGIIAGYIKLNIGKAQTDDKLENALEVERIYVINNYKGKSVGRQLLQKSFALAKSLNIDQVWLGVWENNLKAVAFYKKHGFYVFSEHEYILGTENQRDLLLKKELI